MGKAENEVSVSPSRLRRADRHRCYKYDLVKVDIEYEDDKVVHELITYKDLQSKAHYIVRCKRFKKAKRFNGMKTVKLERKNKI